MNIIATTIILLCLIPESTSGDIIQFNVHDSNFISYTAITYVVNINAAMNTETAISYSAYTQSHNLPYN